MTSHDPVALGLPHRAPFIFVDAITGLTPGEDAEGRIVFSEATPFFRGHFPGDPLVPGVILTEALAQVAGIAAGQAGVPMRLAAIKSMKFPAAARPEEVIWLQAKKIGAVGGLWQFAVAARLNDQVVAEGVVVLAAGPASA